MAVFWSASAREDLEYLHVFLATVDRDAADEVASTLVAGVRRLARQRRLGVRLPEFEPREVRRLFVGDYEVRYELTERDLFVLRIWHQREAR